MSMSSEYTTTSTQSTGVLLIRDERERQIETHGFNAARDDTYTADELTLAAMHYADSPDHYAHNNPHVPPPFWPKDWDRRFDQKSTDNRIAQLAKAGALIAAEIDRLLRAGEGR